MKGVTKCFLAICVVCFAVLAEGAPVPRTEHSGKIPAVNPADYPSLDDKELGQVRRIVKLSRQLPGDWSGMGTDLWGVAERTKQFELAYMADTLGLVQHNYTPAYRELYRTAMDDLIQKMTLPDVWESWINSSRAGAYRNRSDDTSAGWIDPIRKYNIMLKGYLLQAGAMYDMLYRDGKYDEPGAFTFRYVPFTWGNGPVIYRYSLTDVAKIVHQEFVDGQFHGVQCEPNLIFPQCNQSPILGLLNYDQTHSTRYAEEIMPRFKAEWEQNNYTDPVTKHNVGYVLAASGDKVTPVASVLSDSWAGAWMNSWDPAHMQSTYPAIREQYLSAFLNGSYAAHLPDYGNRDLIGAGFGMFAFMAAEMGDAEARTKLLDYADRNFHPVWEDGTYYYPMSYDYPPDANGNSHGIDTWSGNVLLAMARLDTSGGFSKLYHEPWGKAQLDAPIIEKVEYRAVNVSQAFWDGQKKALVVTIKAGPAKQPRASFTVNHLDASATYHVLKDGKQIALVSPTSSQTGDVVRRNDGTVTISTDLTSPHSFVVVAEQ